MKYKVGDKVRVRRDLQIRTHYEDYIFVSGMNDYKGSVVTISKVYSTYYCIEEDIENWMWTDEMFEGLADEELTAEEAIKIQAEMCSSISDCANCPINKEKGGCTCEFFKAENPEKVVRIIKQWKKDHEKKEIETENVDIIKVMKEEGDDETCIYAYEIDINEEDVDEKMDELVKQYYEENGGKIYAKFEHLCRVKS